MPNRLRVPLFGALVILPLLISSCYPFQGDITQILTPAAPPTADATAEPAEPEMVTLVATVAVNALRVRQAPNEETPIIAGLLKDDVINVVGRTEDGSWLKVEVPDVGTIGWIWAEDVTLNGDPSALLVPEDAQMAAEHEDAMAEEADEEQSDDGKMAEEEKTEDQTSAFADLEPSVLVYAQEVIKGQVTVAEAAVPVEGWVVIHADDAGSFGPIIGQAPLEPGLTTDLAVDIDVDAATETLYAMLHTDGGVFDVFEFPGTDMPVLRDGAPISSAFTVTIGEMSTSDEEADAEEAVPVTTPTDEPLLQVGEVTRHLAIVTTRALRVRSKPETIAEVLAGVAVGEAYPVAGFSSDEHWVAIFFPNIEDPVWIAASLVELRDIELRVQMGRATIETGRGGRLRLRGGPTLEAPIVGYAQDGESYDTLGYSEDGQWALLIGTGAEGATWASITFLLFE
ncbi:MAG: SH3 domain-containing protein [Caldilineaceae bacterium SB0670_bin_27]|uniref:SH3 domain-containing protein n=1 Tax=Caldilineaceae bacterium SB0664_bin_27 TaxID=2605260 RepID=A0A6B0YRS4_9CHLR|nr:SH3 domain-containing protein [Caldilineaceae bacterium SB0664_bin_27]MYJ79133.1 SH3 domain-containing protein [Caldilineaceae bacterium SB0670_bin_27]